MRLLQGDKLLGRVAAERTVSLMVAVASIAIAAIVSEAQTDNARVAAIERLAMAIPDEYEEPPGGWLPTCNPDSSVCAYHALKGAETFVVVNGKPGSGYEDVRHTVLSPAGRAAYEARRNASWFVVVDGQEGPPFDRIERLTFSGETVGYVGERAKRRRVVFGDQMSDEDSAIVDVTLSPDGKSYAHVTRREQTMVFLSELYRNGKYVWEDNLISHVSFTNDGHLVFASRTGTILKGRTKLMVDDRIVSEHNEIIDRVAISRDGRRLAAVACAGAAAQKRCILTLDGKTVRTAAEIDLPTFSPDGQTLAYAERPSGGRWHVVVGDRPEIETDTILDGVVFSPDSKRHAYPVRIGASVAVAADGVIGASFDTIDGIVFSPDSNHVAYAASKAGRGSVVLDGVTGPAYAWTSAPGFDVSGKTLMFLAQEGRRFLRIEAAVPRAASAVQ